MWHHSENELNGFAFFSFTTSGWLINEACHTDVFLFEETTTGVVSVKTWDH